MDEFPDLEKLSVADKDQLIRDLWPLRALVRDLAAQVTALQLKVTELEARLASNSRNSSKPPSSDGLNKPKPKSLRKRGERPTGGQKGHKGHTLEKVANADRIVQHAPPAQCNACHRLLPESWVVETRQVSIFHRCVLRSPSIRSWPRSARVAIFAGANCRTA